VFNKISYWIKLFIKNPWNLFFLIFKPYTIKFILKVILLDVFTVIFLLFILIFKEIYSLQLEVMFNFNIFKFLYAIKNCFSITIQFSSSICFCWFEDYIRTKSWLDYNILLYLINKDYIEIQKNTSFFIIHYLVIIWKYCSLILYCIFFISSSYLYYLFWIIRSTDFSEFEVIMHNTFVFLFNVFYIFLNEFGEMVDQYVGTLINFIKLILKGEFVTVLKIIREYSIQFFKIVLFIIKVIFINLFSFIWNLNIESINNLITDWRNFFLGILVPNSQYSIINYFLLKFWQLKLKKIIFLQNKYNISIFIFNISASLILIIHILVYLFWTKEDTFMFRLIFYILIIFIIL